jgi:8-oxo-dGTP pyrophosphatase MutT (NUDIX family)
MPTLGGFAVIVNANAEVLLDHRTDLDAWNLPERRVESCESPWDAVIREVEEEVGLVFAWSACSAFTPCLKRTMSFSPSDASR